MDDTGRSAVPPSTRPVVRRAARAPQSHTPNSSACTCTPPAGEGPTTPDKPAPPGSLPLAAAGRSNSSHVRDRGQPRRTSLHFGPQHHHARLVCLRTRPDHQIDRRQRGKHVDSYDLPQPPFQSISLDPRSLVLGDDEPHARMRNGGSGRPEIEVLGPEALPPSYHSAKFGGPRQPMAARKPDAIRRLRRTCSVVGPSAAYDPSCGAGSGLHAPSAWPCASGIRASGSGACSGGDTSACPYELHEVKTIDKNEDRLGKLNGLGTTVNAIG